MSLFCLHSECVAQLISAPWTQLGDEELWRTPSTEPRRFLDGPGR